MRNIFNGNAYPSAPQSDLFGGIYVPSDTFRWVVGVFSGDGATQAIIKTNKASLATYFPIRFNAKGEPTPLWRPYLFAEFRDGITMDLFRSTTKFIKVISERDEDGIYQPVLVRRGAVQESMAMVMAGRFNERAIVRQFYGKGSIVRVIEGTFIDKKVRLDEDIFPDWRGNHRVKVDIDGIKGSIEVYKLTL
jgi:hypothetical protein